MASVFKPKGRKKWYIKYKDENGNWKTTPGYTDKQASLAKGKELEREAERIAAGLIKRESKESIQNLVNEYLEGMRYEDRTENHIKWTKRILDQLIENLNWKTLKDINPRDMKKYLATLKENDKSPRTINSYRDMAVAFLNWCIKQEYIENNVLTRIPKAKGEKTRPRRAYELEEFQALLGLENKRKLFYLTAGLSGFRTIELKRMQKNDFDPRSPKPKWKLRAKCDKSRKQHLIPMVPELAEALLEPWNNMSDTEKLFRFVPSPKTLYNDLEKVSIPKINELGKRVDLHSFRYFFCVQMARKLPIQVVTRLMRHASISMTADLYGRLEIEDLGLDVWALPTILKPPDQE